MTETESNLNEKIFYHIVVPYQYFVEAVMNGHAAGVLRELIGPKMTIWGRKIDFSEIVFFSFCQSLFVEPCDERNDQRVPQYPT